ncbi:hypothetical protein SO802_005596 [Lithocarpus litseifolius]|uniref:Uncharacterized protein n=1 Tax=Lithocarpus litseifolius TaxID=425828 RepID=A0AAW2DIL7_9ROSI
MASNNYSREELRRKILETRSHRVTLINDDNVNTTFLQSPPPPPPPPPPSPASSTSSSSSPSSTRHPFRVTHTKSSPSSFFPNVQDPDQRISASPLHHQSNAEPEGEDDASDSSEDIQIALDDMMKVQPSLDTSALQRISIDKEPLQLSPNE